jgi:peptide/nickel transport system permease protein
MGEGNQGRGTHGTHTASYLINRLFTLFLTVFIAATLIWIIPRLSPIDPST